MSEKEAHGQGFSDGVSSCETIIADLNAEVSRLQGELAEVKEKQVFLHGERMQAIKELEASEQARQEAVRELNRYADERRVERIELLNTIQDYKSRLTKAEASLRKATELWASKDLDGDRELACLDFGPAQELDEILGVDAFLAEQVQKKIAALQPEGEPK